MHLKKLLFLAIIILFSSTISAQKLLNDFTTVFEKSKGTETSTYQETIAFYKKLAAAYPEISIMEMGETDSGYHLNLVVFNTSKEFDFDKIHGSKKNSILINNAIHPGEPDGADASMMLLRDLVQDKNKIKN